MKTRIFYQWRWTADLFVWTFFCFVLGGITLVYLSLGWQAGEGSPVMPLDDTYIHFQYARQLANGHPFVYNTGDNPTSGATSFIYSPLLAAGYLAGFQGLALGYWALLIGTLFFLFSTWLVYRLTLDLMTKESPSHSQRLFAGTMAMGFLGNGAFNWAAFSGMETLLFVFAVLLAFYSSYRHRFYGTILAGCLTALVRPEGAVIALPLAFVLVLRHRQERRAFAVLFLFAAVFLQPALNLGLTGSATANGTLAKSLLYNETISLSDRLQNVWDYWVRLWKELFSWANPVDGAYIPPLIPILAIVAVIFTFYATTSREKKLAVWLGVLWIIGLSAAVATLETAFWHFKRYQLPLMALIFPLAGWALYESCGRLPKHGQKTALILAGGISLFSVVTTLDFARRYADNVRVVQNQQVAMARWVDRNLPRQTRIGVHDVGVMAYFGNRLTYDLVGLTTEGTAAAWRQGSGAIFESLRTHPERPDYFAVYHDIHSLPFLADAGVFGAEMARFTYSLPKNTVASATSTQIVSQALWTTTDNNRPPQQPSILQNLNGWRLLATVNVADLDDEKAHEYLWWNRERPPGFATQVYRLPYVSCMAESCLVTDGGRILSGGESFELPPLATGERYLVVLRAHAASPARLIAGCKGHEDFAVIPSIPGHWIEVPFLLGGDTERFCLEVEAGIYQPYHYWIYAGDFPAREIPTEWLATVVGPVDGHDFQIVDASSRIQEDKLLLRLRWYSDGTLQQDGKMFIHLYGDSTQPPLAQRDVWLGGDTLPPANWLPGVYTETITVDIAHLAAGTYALAIGFYDPLSEKRYSIVRENQTTERLFLTEITLNDR